MKMKDSPIEDARNLGPISGQEFRSIGIDTVEKLVEIGWREACLRLVDRYPKRINLNAFTAIIGATTGEDWRNVDPELKKEAQVLLKSLKGTS
jgi:DNA transformation protein